MASQPKSKTTVSTPSEREVFVQHVFQAPRAKVFECLLEPRHVRLWLASPEWAMPVCEAEVRVGGRYHYVWRKTTDDQGAGNQFGFIGEYREIIAPQSVVHTEWADDTPGGPEVEVLCTLKLQEIEEGTALSVLMLFPSKEARDAALYWGISHMSNAYERLDGHLTQLTP